MYFSAKGYQVETAAGGVECMTKLRQLQPSALIIDLELPWGGGAGVCRLILEDRALSSIPVILTHIGLTGENIPPDLHNAAVEVLQKPFPMNGLLLHVHTAIALGAAERSGVLA
jgi:CheY-like chemotaxis protein